MFSDVVQIVIRSGNGGNGHISFRREKYIPNGGPDGGDGGKGGNVVFRVKDGLNTLSDFRRARKYCAGNGEEGKKQKCHGKDGKDIILEVPSGTLIRDSLSGKIIADMSGDTKEKIILKGGRGGLGNMHFATASMQAPRYARPGKPGLELAVTLELKLIADVGLIGFPNAGKSTFLSRISNARPKIADYHFTTLKPNLGVAEAGYGAFVAADIPGLIVGASKGAGLGFEFLRHIERTRVLIHLVDIASAEGRDPVDDVYRINSELKEYHADLADKPQVIAANKIDALYVSGNDENPVIRLKKEFEPLNIPVFPISSVTGEGIEPLLLHVSEMLSELKDQKTVYEQEFFPEDAYQEENLNYIVEYDEKNKEYIVEGPKVDKMLGYTNLESEKGFAFFQKFLDDSGITADLEKSGIREGDTVRIYGHLFEYYKSGSKD